MFFHPTLALRLAEPRNARAQRPSDRGDGAGCELLHGDQNEDRCPLLGCREF
jgi:hypothetical protein